MKLAIIAPTMRYMDSRTAFSLAAMSATAAQHEAVDDLILKNLSIGYIDLARTMLAYDVLNMGADAILWIDHDMVFPADTFARLLAHEVEIVGALYRNRTPPHFQRMEPYLKKSPRSYGLLLEECAWLPGGLMLVRREVYEKLGMPFYRAGWGLDPANPAAHIGEDIDFAKRVRGLGFKMYADTFLTEEVEHIAEIGLAWHMGENRERKEVDRGSDQASGR